jgi:hypothetical protein
MPSFVPIGLRLRRVRGRPDTCDFLKHTWVQIAREGREGRHIGTLFTFGDADAVLKILPTFHHPTSR